MTHAIDVPPPGAHGGDAARLAEVLGVDWRDVLDLSVSLNPDAPGVAELVGSHAAAVAHYPDPGPSTTLLAGAMGIDPDRLLLTNGGSEAIALVATQFPIGHVTPPDFSLYERHLAALDAGAPRWRSNPHNPTGRLAGAGERAAVWDEAFYALATGHWTRGDHDVVVVGSLTKLFGCPGLRLGYVIAPRPDVTRAIAARQPAWSVSSIACAVLPELLGATDLPGWARGVATRRARLATMLRRAGLDPDPSDANYVLVRAAAGVRARLARRGILVRDTGSFGLPDGVRIAVPDDAGLERLDDALRQEWGA